MTRDEFRALALTYPEAVETETDGATLFTVAGRAFARLRHDTPRWVDVMLTRADAEAAGAGEPELFAPLPHGWFRTGYTQINIQKAGLHSVTSALDAAWQNAAPQRVVRRQRRNGKDGA